MVIRQKAVTLSISTDMANRARVFSEKSTDQTFNRFTYEWKTRVEKVYVGKLGEEALRFYFLNSDLQVDEIDYNTYIGTASIDETDLKVGNKNIDVKVGTQEFHKRLLIVKQYFDNMHQSDYYVAINLYDNLKTAVIYGYASKNQIAHAPIGKFDKVNPVFDYYLFYDSLAPIENLVKDLLSDK